MVVVAAWWFGGGGGDGMGWDGGGMVLVFVWWCSGGGGTWCGVSHAIPAVKADVWWAALWLHYGL